MSECADGTGMLVVSGASGAGKSSLLRAGVLPRLRGEGLAAVPGSESWPYVPLTPGRAPLDTLAMEMARRIPGANAAALRGGLEADPERFALTVRQAALGSPAATPGESSRPVLGEAPQQKRLLLLVYQFEQLFTQCGSEDERQASISALHFSAATGAALVLLVVRADFEVRCADYPYLTEAVQDRYLLTAMNDRELRAAISEPAKKADGSVDGDLIDVLLHEMGSRHQHRDIAVLHEWHLPLQDGSLQRLSSAYSLSRMGPRTFCTFIGPRAGLMVRRMNPWEPVSGIGPLTRLLQEARPRVPYAPALAAAAMTRAIVLTAPAALGLSIAPFHEPFRADGRQWSTTVTERPKPPSRVVAIRPLVTDEYPG